MSYDLLNPLDYKAFADKYGEPCARAIRFGMAYGMTGKSGTLKHTAFELANTPAIRQVDFDALYAAFGQGDKR